MSINGQLKRFTSYRQFLQFHFESKTENNPKWSLTAWAKNLSLSGPSLLSMILSGKRHPSEGLTKKLIDYFQFNEEDEIYFRDLITLEKRINHPRLSMLFKKELVDNHKNPVAQFQIGTFVIKEMFKLKDHVNEYSWYKKRYKTNLPQSFYEQARNFLGEKNHNESIQQVTSAKEEQLYELHHSINKIVDESFHLSQSDQRKFLTSVLAIKKDDIPKAMKLLREFQLKFMDLFESSEADEVMILNLNLVPATKNNQEQKQ